MPAMASFFIRSALSKNAGGTANSPAFSGSTATVAPALPPVSGAVTRLVSARIFIACAR
jgi:hypothetical protein